MDLSIPRERFRMSDLAFEGCLVSWGGSHLLRVVQVFDLVASGVEKFWDHHLDLNGFRGFEYAQEYEYRVAEYEKTRFSSQEIT